MYTYNIKACLLPILMNFDLLQTSTSSDHRKASQLTGPQYRFVSLYASLKNLHSKSTKGLPVFIEMVQHPQLKILILEIKSVIFSQEALEIISARKIVRYTSPIHYIDCSEGYIIHWCLFYHLCQTQVVLFHDYLQATSDIQPFPYFVIIITNFFVVH